MKYLQKTLVVLAVLSLSGLPAAYASIDVGFSINFHSSLTPYGSWVNVGAYGSCWRPYAARNSGWRPYLNGHWTYTSYGPTWMGDEPWAWCAYHYGHWGYDNYYGWVWVPGYDWVPADVSWSYGDGYIGWCPSYCASNSNPFSANLWVFVDRDHFGYNNYARCAIGPDVVRNFFYHGNRHIDRFAPRRDELERFTRRQIPMESVREHEVFADGHRARLIVPQHEESTVLRNMTGFAERSAPIVQERKYNGQQRYVPEVRERQSRSDIPAYRGEFSQQPRYESRTYVPPRDDQRNSYGRVENSNIQRYAPSIERTPRNQETHISRSPYVVQRPQTHQSQPTNRGGQSYRQPRR